MNVEFWDSYLDIELHRLGHSRNSVKRSYIVYCNGETCPSTYDFDDTWWFGYQSIYNLSKDKKKKDIVQ